MNHFEKILVATLKDALDESRPLGMYWREGARAVLKQIEERDRDDGDDFPSNKEYVATADRIHGKDGECEIDEDAVVSRSDDHGAYVQAWVWVYDTDVDPEKYKENDDS